MARQPCVMILELQDWIRRQTSTNSSSAIPTEFRLIECSHLELLSASISEITLDCLPSGYERFRRVVSRDRGERTLFLMLAAVLFFLIPHSSSFIRYARTLGIVRSYLHEVNGEPYDASKLCLPFKIRLTSSKDLPPVI